MTGKNYKKFKVSTKCWICKKKYNKKRCQRKRSLSHYWKSRGSAHKECYPNISLTKKVTVVFHNLQNYDSHLIV